MLGQWIPPNIVVVVILRKAVEFIFAPLATRVYYGIIVEGPFPGKRWQLQTAVCTLVFSQLFIISGLQIFQYNTFFVEAYIKNRDVNIKKNEAHINKGKTPRTVHSIKRSSSINKEVNDIFFLRNIFVPFFHPCLHDRILQKLQEKLQQVKLKIESLNILQATSFPR